MTPHNLVVSFFRKKALLFFVLAALIAPVVSYSQISPTRFRHVSYEQGLSNTTILCIMQDSRGFMWFGTRDGLNRYDGVNVTVYKNNPHVSSSIRDNFIRCIYEGADHNIWIGTSYGLASFDPRSDKFTRYWHSYQGKRAGDDIVTSICDDAQHNLWISTLDSGMYRLDAKTHYFSHFTHTNKAGSISSDSVNYLYKDKHNQVWVGTVNGLNSLDAKTGTFKLFRQADKGANNITSITEDNAGKLWLGTANSGVVVFSRSNNEDFVTIKHNDNSTNTISSNLVISIMADRKDNIWIGTDGGGMTMYNQHKGMFYNYAPVPDNSNSLSNLTVSALYEDVQGNLWIGTHRGGVNMYSAGMDKFKLFREGVAANTLSYDDVKAFFQDAQGNIWVGTDGGGLNLFDKKTGTFKRYQYDPRNPKSLSSNAVQAIAADAQGNLWVGTWGGGLNMMDKQTGEFTHFRADSSKTSLSSDFLQRLFLDSKGNFWVATYYGGLNKWNPQTHNFTRITKDSTGKTSFSGKDVVSIGEDHDHNVWFGTDDGGLNKYNLDSKTFSHYFDHEEKKTDSRVLFTDMEGRLWLGQAGLYLFDKPSNTFKLYSHKCGLDTNFIKGITQGNHHNLWISTSNGLVKLYPKTGDAVLFNTSDGLQGMEFEANSYMKANDGEMYFGGINGFNSFYPDNIKINQFVPPVYITGLQFFNKTVKPGAADSILKEDVSFGPQFGVNHRFNSVSFTFAALNYINSANNQYKYKLEGFDTTWTEAGSEHKAVYTNLDPGTYVFKVIASNNDGIWNEKGASVMFTIEKPIWTRWWFRIIVLAIIVSIVISYNRYTTNELRR